MNRISKFIESFINFVFCLWFKIGKVMGLILIEYDESKDMFVVWNYSSFYSIIVGLLATVTYPYAYYTLISLLALVTQIDISFSILVSVFGEALTYFSLMLGYVEAILNRHKLKDLMNDILSYEKCFSKEFPHIESAKECKMKYQMLFVIGIVIGLFTLLQHITVMLVVIDLSRFNLILAVCIVPMTVSFVVSGQFFLCVLIIKYNINRIHHALDHMKKIHDNSRNLEMLSSLEESLRLSDNIDKLAVMHKQLYDINSQISRLYTFQMLFVVLSNFVSIMLDMFYIFIAVYFNSLNILTVRIVHLGFCAVCGILITLTNVFYNLKTSTVVSNSVRSNLYFHFHVLNF